MAVLLEKQIKQLLNFKLPLQLLKSGEGGVGSVDCNYNFLCPARLTKLNNSNASMKVATTPANGR